MGDRKKIAVALVYYREIPNLLELFLSSEKGFSFSKDGVSKDIGHQVPRITVFLECDSQGRVEEKTVKRLERVLRELDSNNQISGFSIKIKYKEESRRAMG